jgi:acyl-CoA thioesterase FadM
VSTDVNDSTVPHSNVASPSFTTSPIPVYIEDTDAYGVIYNANYLRAYDRAIQSWNTPTKEPGQQNTNFIISKVESMKYKQSPMLGEKYVINGRPRELSSVSSSSSCHSNPVVWDLTMTSPDGSIVYNVAQGVHVMAMSPAQKRLKDVFTTGTVNGEEKASDFFQSVFTHEYVTHRDEFDTNYRIPLHTHLKYFERSRSDALGGPRSLRKLQEQENVLVVVTSNHDCESLVVLASDNDDETMDERAISTVRVTTGVRLRRRSSVVECYQTACFKSKPIARALTTVMVIDAASKKPTPLPDWVLQENQFLS